jgi:peptidyl-prolyl cis-trans isomerase SurA
MGGCARQASKHVAIRLTGLLGAAVLGLTGSGLPPAGAQTPQLPGLVVTIPPAPPPQPPTPQAAAPLPQAAVPAPAQKPSVKPRPKPTAAAPTKTASINPGAGVGKGGQAIVVLVNDDPITAYEIEQRQRLMALQANIGQRAQENMKRLAASEETQKQFRAQAEEIIRANQGKTREQIVALIEQRKAQFAQALQKQAVEGARASVLPGLKKAATEELIEERLKLQEAKRGNITIEDAQVDGVIKNLAERNKVTPQQFAQNIANMGADINTMKSRFRAQLAWTEVVRRRFAAQVTVNQRDVEKLITAATGAEDQVDLQLQRITLPLAAKLDQKKMAERYDQAEQLRQRFAGCKSTAAVAAKVDGAKFEDLGVRKPATIAEPTRTLLLSANEGEMVPPSVGSGGLEIYVVCGRKVVKADDQKRQAAQQEQQAREFEILAKRHIRDLRQDAAIEYR